MNTLIRNIMLFTAIIMIAFPVNLAAEEMKQLKRVPTLRSSSPKLHPIVASEELTCKGEMKWSQTRARIYSFIRSEDGSCRGIIAGSDGKNIVFEDVRSTYLCDDIAKWHTGSTNVTPSVRKIRIYGCTDGQLHDLPEGLDAPTPTGYIFTNITKVKLN